MNRVFLGFFVAFLMIPTKPTFGVRDAYEHCKRNAGMRAFSEWAFSGVPTQYQAEIDKIVKSPVEQGRSGTCTPGGSYICNKGDILKDCCPCAQFIAERQVQKIFEQDYIKKECDHLKQTATAKPQVTQTTDNNTDNEPDLMAVSANQNVSNDQQESSVATTKTKKEPVPQSRAEQERLARTAFAKFCKDDGYVYKDKDTEMPSVGTLDAQCEGTGNRQVDFRCYKFKTSSVPEKDIHAHLAYYCYSNVTNTTRVSTATRPSDHYNKKEAERVAKQEANKALCEKNGAGTWTDKNKCECVNPTHSFVKGQGCVQDDKKAERVAKQEANKALCEKNGAGTWTDKNKCECANPTHSFVKGQGCVQDDKKAEYEKYKGLCKSPNEWNDKTHKCKCKNKSDFFDKEEGCVAATSKFNEAKGKIDNLKTQLDTKITELNTQQ